MSASRAVRRLPVVLAALVAAPLLLGACGSSGNDASTTEQPSATSAPRGTTEGTSKKVEVGTSTTEPEEDTTTTTRKKSTTTTGADDGTTTTKKKSTTSTTGVVTDPAFAEYCGTYVRLMNDFEDADMSDPNAFIAQLKTVYDTLAAAAPGELKGDIQTVNDWIQANVTTFEDFDKAPTEIQDLGDKVEDISKEKCGLD